MPSEVLAPRAPLRPKFLLPALVFGLCAAIAQAADTAASANTPLRPPGKDAPASPITDHFSLRATFSMPTVSTDARFDSNAGVAGTPFNAESDLGLDDKLDQGRVEMIIRLRERHRVRIDYLKIDRDGDKLLARPITFGNSTYNVNDRVLSTGASYWVRLVEACLPAAGAP